MLEARRFRVRERVKFLKTYATYDLYDADNPESPVGLAEEQLGTLVGLLRWFVSKQFLPTRVEVREMPEGALVFSIARGWYVFRSRVEVHDGQGALVGYFQSKFFTIGGGFHVYDANERHFAEVKGNLIGFKYRLLSPDGEVELGKVSKEFNVASVVRDLFTSADRYVIETNEELDSQPLAKMLLLAAALAIDMIFKSESRGGVSLGGE